MQCYYSNEMDFWHSGYGFGNSEIERERMSKNKSKYRPSDIRRRMVGRLRKLSKNRMKRKEWER